MTQQLRPKIKLSPPTAKNRTFDERLLKQWSPLIKSLSKSFTLPGRLDPEDNEQELQVVLWELWQRVDPTEKPDDFRKLIKTEMVNRLIDLYRFHRAQKRSATVGFAVECALCGMVSPCEEDQVPVCSTCGNVGVPGESTPTLKHYQLHSPDIHLESAPETEASHDDSGQPLYWSFLCKPSGSTPIEVASRREIVAKVREHLAPFPDRQFFNLIVDPTPQLVRLLLHSGYQADVSRTPYRVWSLHLGWSEKVLRMAHGRISECVATILGRYDLVRPEED